MKVILLLTVFFVQSHLCRAQSIGVFEQQTNVGNPKLKGGASFDKKSNRYVIKGAGYNIWFNRDEMLFLSKKITGDFTATAKFRFSKTGGDMHRKIGWMIRESLNEDAAHAAATIHGDSLTLLQWRTEKGANMRDPEDEIFYTPKGNELITLARKGDTISMWTAKPGQEPQFLGSTSVVKLPATAFVGIFICSHNPDVLEEAEVWDLKITQ